MLQICKTSGKGAGMVGVGVGVQTAPRCDCHSNASRWMLCGGLFFFHSHTNKPPPKTTSTAPTRRPSATLRPPACRDCSDGGKQQEGSVQHTEDGVCECVWRGKGASGCAAPLSCLVPANLLRNGFPLKCLAAVTRSGNVHVLSSSASMFAASLPLKRQNGAGCGEYPR